MAPIENREALCSHGDDAARELLVDVVDGALAAVHPDRLVPDRLTLRNGTLRVDGRSYELDAADRVLVLGAGKGSLALVRAVGEVLGDWLSRGVVVEKRGHAGGGGGGGDETEATRGVGAPSTASRPTRPATPSPTRTATGPRGR